ncbi:CHAD domain-containing protein [Amaricoccus macauensis]|uniref:CHAD domain-containing protein n=1 Tax=Amaricoccus macauensis TaxID=57001 RepID=UPI003C7D75E4
MAFSLKSEKDGSLQDGVRRIALDQIRTAIAEIDDPDLDRDETVHQVRKRCKKLRGLVRLARPGFDGYKRENARFRDAARRLSGIRDADVLIETYDKLAEHYDAEIDRQAFGQIRRRLTLQRKALLEDDHRSEELAAVRGVLQTAAGAAENWKIGGKGFGTAFDGMKKTYARGRKAMDAARETRSDEAIHDWRKRVKYHRFHAELLRHVWPDVMVAHADAADTLGDLLGDHHDLAVFADALRDDPETFGDGRTVEVALTLVERRKADLEAEAFALGARIFAEKPKRLVKRWKAYAKAGSTGSDAKDAELGRAA